MKRKIKGAVRTERIKRPEVPTKKSLRGLSKYMRQELRYLKALYHVDQLAYWERVTKVLAPKGFVVTRNEFTNETVKVSFDPE